MVMVVMNRLVGSWHAKEARHDRLIPDSFDDGENQREKDEDRFHWVALGQSVD